MPSVADVALKAAPLNVIDHVILSQRDRYWDTNDRVLLRVHPSKCFSTSCVIQQ